VTVNSNSPSDVQTHIVFLKRNREIVVTELRALESKLANLICNPPPPQWTSRQRGERLLASDGVRRAIQKKLEARDDIDLHIAEWQQVLNRLETPPTHVSAPVSPEPATISPLPEPVPTSPPPEPATTSPLPEPVSVAEDVGLSPDENYDSIMWKGKRYDLTPNRSAIIRNLHEAYLRGRPVVKLAHLQEELQISRVRDSFRGTSLYGDLVISVRQPKGGYRLNLPDHPKKA
jgi:hypothetical protein